MSRKLSAAVAALAVAGGVYFTGDTAKASNMGFKLERAFTFQPSGAVRYLNNYFMCYPLFNGLADTARSTGSGDKCAGPADSVTDATDAICDMFTDRATCGTCDFTMTNVNTVTCQTEPYKAVKNTLGLNFVGNPLFGAGTLTLNDPLQRDKGYLIQVTGAVANPPQNRAVIVGSYDPSYLGRTISAATCKAAIVGLPYHGMYRKISEVLCGLAGPDPANGQGDFLDANGDTIPDGPAASRTCPNGIYDPVSGKRVTMQTYDNVPGRPTSGQFVPFFAERNALGLQFTGTNFDLTPGDAYTVALQPGYQDRLLFPPHF